MKAMSDDDPMTRFHLWRRYNSVPYERFAITVEWDETPDGYRITNHDPIVADSLFLSAFATHMATPYRDGMSGYVDDNGTAWTTTEDEAPGTLDHYLDAVRSVPGTSVMSRGASQS